MIYAGTDTGKVWKTSDAGATWVQMQGLPTRWVNKIIADPDDANHAYIAFSGFRQGDDAANVWETRDGGTTWQNISSNLPNGPVENMDYDSVGNVLFAATDVGVFDHKDGDAYWYKISVGLPDVPMTDVRLSGDHKTLYVATFGRSTFKLNLSTDATDGGGCGRLGAGHAGAHARPAGDVRRRSPRASTGSTRHRRRRTSISTAGDATLSVSDPCCLTNGAFSLPEPIQVSFSKSSWSAPVSNDPVAISFKQHIGANQALRTGSYSKTLTFTLSTTNP